MSEKTTPEVVQDELTDDQKKVLSEIYDYHDKASYTQEDIDLAKEMFDTPEKFRLLRKILQVLTQEESGLTIPGPVALLNADESDLKKYALTIAIDSRADEKIRQTLVSFYRILKENIKHEKTEEFKAENKAEFEEKKKTEEFKEKEEAEKRTVGENL